MRFALRSVVTVSMLAPVFLMAQSAMAATTVTMLFPFMVGNQTCPAEHSVVVRDLQWRRIEAGSEEQEFCLANSFWRCCSRRDERGAPVQR
jgi:hypothetical protein